MYLSSVGFERATICDIYIYVVDAIWIRSQRWCIRFLFPFFLQIMDRDFVDSEASTVSGYQFDCVGSDRNIIQIETAVQGLSIAVKKGGLAEKCINKLGGLTIDQLRWMYSNFGEADLRDHGWSDDALPNNDGNPNTKYWSELLDDPACPQTQMKIAGPDPLSL
jgi:hypothetical protein